MKKQQCITYLVVMVTEVNVFMVHDINNGKLH